MSDISLETQNAKKIFDGSLVEGDHDTITLFGIRAQNDLKDYSRRVTALLLKDTVELDMAIADVITEIEHFELKTKKTMNSFWGTQIRHKEIKKEYEKVLDYIDSMSLYFKLQQAQLIKEIKLLEKLYAALSVCSEEIEKCIKFGKKKLSEKKETVICKKDISRTIDISPDITVWYERLEKRIDDLAVTHVIALQSQEQIKMLCDNNLLILDRIASTVSNTFPIWQNQMAIIIGIDLMQTRMNVQEKLVSVSDRYAEQISKKIQRKKINKIQEDKFLGLNRSLSIALEEMARLEESNNILRKEFLNTVEHTERG